MKVVSFLNHAVWHNLLGCVIKALCTPAQEHNGYKEPKLWNQRKGQPVWAPPSLSPIVSAWSPTRLRLRGSYRVNRVSEPSCWGHPPYIYIYTYMFPINRCLSFTAREGSRMGPLEFSGFVWLLCVFACADPCGQLCIHMWNICVFVCMCPLVMHALTCCWSDLGAWTCSSFASVRLLHTPSSFQKNQLWSKMHILSSLLSPWFAQCSDFSVLIWSKYAQQLPIFPVLSPSQFPNQTFQCFLKKAQTAYNSLNNFCFLFTCCRLTFPRTVDEEEFVLVYWRSKLYTKLLKENDVDVLVGWWGGEREQHFKVTMIPWLPFSFLGFDLCSLAPFILH